MKLFIRLAILVATFLLITNIALANHVGCDQEACYNGVMSVEEGSTVSGTFAVCLNNDGTGLMLMLINDEDFLIPLAVFGGSPFGASFNLTPGWSTWVIQASNVPMTGFFLTQADGIYVMGEGTIEGFRWIYKGAKVPCSFL